MEVKHYNSSISSTDSPVISKMIAVGMPLGFHLLSNSHFFFCSTFLDSFCTPDFYSFHYTFSLCCIKAVLQVAVGLETVFVFI